MYANNGNFVYPRHFLPEDIMYPWSLAMGQILPLHKVPQGCKVPRGRYDPNFLFWCGFFIRYYGYYYMAIILYSITINMII